jgi:hypothetical protein
MFKNLKIHILIIFFAYRNILLEWRDMLDPKKRKIFNERLELCKKCSYRDPNLNLCSVCKCPIKPKTRGDYDLDDEGKSIFGCPYRYW